MLLPTAVADILTPLTQEFLPLQGVHAATAVRGYTNAHSAAISNFPSQQRQEGFVFKHPLTVNMLGPTCWQPLYDVIQSKVYSKVEYIQGILLDLDQDFFY